MNSNRSWNILNWNVRGLNSSVKWLATRQKVEESAIGIVCIQETKRENFDLAYIHNFCPWRFNKFEYLPSSLWRNSNCLEWNFVYRRNDFLKQILFIFAVHLQHLFQNLDSHQHLWALQP